MNNAWFLQDLMSVIADRGRTFLPASLFGADPELGLQDLANALMAGRGEASSVAIAQQLLRHYEILEDDRQRSAFFRYIAERFQPNEEIAVDRAEAYIANPGRDTLQALQKAIESPQQEFIRRLNLAPNGTAAIVHMREDLLRLDLANPALRSLDRDIIHLLQSWFNRGFLVLQRIDWQTPALILDRIIDYEAVHEITGWEDLKRRLHPADRRCFAFFHPSLVDEPLIFVEVALMNEVPSTIADVLQEKPKGTSEPEMRVPPTVAVFYSISNCQAGLRGISFGNFLIKQVVEELAREHPSLKTFVTLSPVPRFARWLAEADLDGEAAALRDQLVVEADAPEAASIAAVDADDVATLESLAARYFMTERRPDGHVIDPVARFHLGNGARLERINVNGDLSVKGLRESHGVMVNYLYEPREIERNHEQFVNDGTVAASKGVRALVKGQAAADAARAIASDLPKAS
ncbi:MAG: malonyl-CoA decarboxylase [Pseudomonadota bacterium]